MCYCFQQLISVHKFAVILRSLLNYLTSRELPPTAWRFNYVAASREAFVML